MQDLKVTIIQSDLFWEKKQKNLDAFSEKISALKEKVDIIVLPEVFNTAFSMNPEKLAETMTGSSMNWLKEKAATTDAVIVASLMIYENGNHYNRFVWVSPNGSVSHYDKRHLFRMGEEGEQFTCGAKKTIIQYKNWKILPMICYDLRFPVWSKNVIRNQQFDYDIIIYIANWPAPRNHPWKTLLQARAIENQAFVVGVNRIGSDGMGLDYCGDSMIVDYMGKPLVHIPNHEKTETVNLSLEDLHNFRKKFNVAFDWDDFELKL
jgi:omega-amidase